MYSLNCKGSLLSWEHPIVMGILNMTPDSFYPGSRIRSEETLLKKAEKMLNDGASIIDIGGSSSRPGAQETDPDEEMQRIIQAIQMLKKHFPELILSVDSYRYKVVEAALQAGASIINDIGAAPEENIALLAVREQVPYICMHIRGNPRTMQQLNQYDDITTDVLDFFIQRVSDYRKMGLKDVIIDPGFGFAKSIEQNFKLLGNMHALGMLDVPVLVGLSRKATVYKTLGIQPEESLNGTTVMHTLALQQGASILRVHDVKEAVEVIRLWTSYAAAQNVHPEADYL